MSTTIQITEEMKTQLNGLKMHPRDTYNDVLERVLEDMMELNARTRKEIEKALREIERGECMTHEDVGKEMGF